MAKRTLDLILSLVGLVLLWPLLASLALWIKLDSPGPVFYRGKRVGQHSRTFFMYKFRTMVQGAARRGPAVTYRDDPRITRAGRFLRRTKLDELPQLLNVVKGEMSLVGPRPEDPRYVALYTEEQRQVLSVKPGVTGPTQLEYRDEASMLDGDSVDEDYVTRIMPEKLKLDLEYVRTHSLIKDLSILWRTGTTLLLRDRGQV
ncbi:MAG: sugar transferase [Anaerolineae bacterium]|nr:sugar transferase [Anaerolineae bacterium]